MPIGGFDTTVSLASCYLDERGGSSIDFRQNLASHQRLGQAFFNSLSPKDAERLRGSLHDPFYLATPEGTIKAIEFLLDTEDK